LQNGNQTVICRNCGKSRDKNINKCPACGSTKVRINNINTGAHTIAGKGNSVRKVINKITLVKK